MSDASQSSDEELVRRVRAVDEAAARLAAMAGELRDPKATGP